MCELDKKSVEIVKGSFNSWRKKNLEINLINSFEDLINIPDEDVKFVIYDPDNMKLSQVQNLKKYIELLNIDLFGLIEIQKDNF